MGVGSIAGSLPPPSISRCAPGEPFLGPVCLDGRSELSCPVDSILCKHPSSGVSSPAAVTNGNRGCFESHFCFVGLSPSPICSSSVGQMNSGALDAGAVNDAPPILSLGSSDQSPSMSFLAEPPLLLGASDSSSQCQSAAPGFCPTGVSWASVVEKRTIGDDKLMGDEVE